MNWLDIVIAVVLVISLISGLKNGLIRAVFSLAGIVGGVILAGHYYASLGRKIPLDNPQWAEIVAYVIIFIIVLIVALAIGSLVRKALHWVALGWVDRLVGAILGLAIGSIICGAVLIAVLKFFEPSNQVISNSALAAFLIDKFPLVLNLLPQDFQSVKEFFK